MTLNQIEVESELATALKQLALLRKPFKENQISLLPKPYKKDSPKGNCKECGGYHGLPAVHLSYVGHAALTDRLLDVDPLWSWEPLAIDANGLPALDKDGGMWIKLTVCGITRLGYGDAQGKTGGDATKERIGDALRNAAMRFGAALDLWHKGVLHMDEDDIQDIQPNDAARLWIAEINSVTDLAQLKVVWGAVLKKVDKDTDTFKAIEAAKDERKKHVQG